MTLFGKGKIRVRGTGKDSHVFLSVPKTMYTDSNFPFNVYAGETVRLYVETTPDGKVRLIAEKT